MIIYDQPRAPFQNWNARLHLQSIYPIPKIMGKFCASKICGVVKSTVRGEEPSSSPTGTMDNCKVGGAHAKNQILGNNGNMEHLNLSSNLGKQKVVMHISGAPRLNFMV